MPWFPWSKQTDIAEPSVEEPKQVQDIYAGAEPSKNRSQPRIDNRPDHYILTAKKRAAMNSTLVDVARNHSLTRWAIRQDQNWIADCRFEACTGNSFVDDQLTEIVDGLLNPNNFDYSGRHGIHSFSRLMQAGRTLHGDGLILKCRDFPGGRVKYFPFDRISHPNPPSKQWIQGIELEPYTDRTLRYAIRQRDIESGKLGKLWRVVDAKDAILHGYFEFDSEAVRGVSPLAPVVNSIIDLYESITYTHAKVKLGQLLGLVVYRKAVDSMRGRQIDPETGKEVQQKPQERWEWEVSGGPWQLDLDIGEKAELLESKTPSKETMDLIAFACRDSLKAFDIPYCWWDGEAQNFYGSIGETNLYRKACEHKRKSHFETMREVLRFFFQMAIIERRLILPADMTVDSLKFRLIPNGVAWFKPTEETQAAALAIALGLSSPQLECEKINANFDTNIAQTKEAIAKMLDAGMVPQFGTPPQEKITVNSDDEDEPTSGTSKRKPKQDDETENNEGDDDET